MNPMEAMAKTVMEQMNEEDRAKCQKAIFKYGDKDGNVPEDLCREICEFYLKTNPN